MTESKDNTSFEFKKLFDNLNNLKEALDVQASNDAKIEPIAESIIEAPNKIEEILIEDKTKFRKDGL